MWINHKQNSKKKLSKNEKHWSGGIFSINYDYFWKA